MEQVRLARSWTDQMDERESGALVRSSVTPPVLDSWPESLGGKVEWEEIVRATFGGTT